MYAIRSYYDYLTKPFEPQELLFRIKALLRRYQMVSAESIKLGDTIMNRKGYEVHCKGKQLMLPLKEFELLFQLASYVITSYSIHYTKLYDELEAVWA